MLGKGAGELVVEVAVVKVTVTVAVSDLVIVVIIVSVVAVVIGPVPSVLVHVLVVYETSRPGGPVVHTTPLEEIRHRDRMDRTDNTRPYIADLLLELSNAAR